MMIENLAWALGLGRASQVGLVGAGGKTAALFRLARDLGAPAILSCSAHMGVWQLHRAGEHRIVTGMRDLEFLDNALGSILLLTGPPDSAGERMRGLDASVMEALHLRAAELGFPLIIEADGSRRLPLKAPAEHEPPLPVFVDTVISTIGLSALGQPLDERIAYGVERVSAFSGLNRGAPITAEAIARLLAHPEGGLKEVPKQARRIALLNQADTPDLRDAGARIAGLLSRSAFDATAVTALESALEAGLPRIAAVYEPAAAIVLAAGGSRRMGSPKLLLPWRGEPLVRHAVRAALEAGPAQVIVVTGAQAAQVEAALDGLDVVRVHNPDWAAGQSTSVRAGLRAVNANCGAAVFLLGDQPQIGGELVRRLIERHATTHAAAVAPFVGGRRGNPVLFDCSLFPQLLAIQGDSGGRQILSNITIEALPWHDEAIFLDIDTPEDLRRTASRY